MFDRQCVVGHKKKRMLCAQEIDVIFVLSINITTTVMDVQKER